MEGKMDRANASTRDQHGSHRQKMRTSDDTDRSSGKVVIVAREQWRIRLHIDMKRRRCAKQGTRGRENKNENETYDERGDTIERDALQERACEVSDEERKDAESIQSAALDDGEDDARGEAASDGVRLRYAATSVDVPGDGGCGQMSD